MKIVIKPELLAQSKLRKCTLSEWMQSQLGEIAALNGDALLYYYEDALWDIIGWSRDLSAVIVELGLGETKTFPIQPGETLYYR
jgi:hypothetical protein